MIYKSLILDRDGVINEDKSYAYKVSDLVFIKGIEELILRAKIKNYKVFCITNQSGIARGYFKESDFHKFMNEINNRLLQSIGFKLDAYYFCPHHPNSKIIQYKKFCNCRKPKNGLFHKAAKDFPLDFKNSFFVGDNMRDIDAAESMDIGNIYLLNKNIKNNSKSHFKIINSLEEVIIN